MGVYDRLQTMENDTNMMKFYSIDSESSSMVYNALKRLIEPKFCYNNVFFVVSNFHSNFMDGKWKVAYGYVSSVQNVFCRHCFVFDTTSELIIDPTASATGNPIDEKKYYIMRVFDTLDSYLEAIDDEHNLPALENYLRQDDIKACRLAHENGLLFI